MCLNAAYGLTMQQLAGSTLRRQPQKSGFHGMMPILQALSQGSSLRQIAQLQNRPYSRIIYRLSCILAKLGLNHRHELLHLLNNLLRFHVLTYSVTSLIPKDL